MSNAGYKNPSIPTEQSAQIESVNKDIFNRLPCGILVLDDHGVIIQVNLAASALLGSILLGERWSCVAEREIMPLERPGHEVRLKNGRFIHVATQSLTQLTGQLLVLTDITESVLLHEKANQFKKLAEMGNLCASLAHQVRNPLTTAMIYANQLAQENRYHEVEKHSSINFANKLIASLLQIEVQIKNMLTYARNGITDFKLMPAREIFSKIITQYNDGIYPASIQLIISEVSPEIHMLCNDTLLHGALENGLYNAMDAMGGEGQIEINVEAKSDGFLDISIIDSGVGISNVDPQKLFEPFYTTKAKGSGLGLAVAKLIAELHGGTVKMMRGRHQGAILTFILPIAKESC